MLIFRNPGTLDPISIKTFGVSSKEKSNAIGFFGTGLKYALAIFLREGCEVNIYTGGESFRFGLKRAVVRVDEFEFVTMNGEQLGFTTELGKTWEPWAAFRELYCNCMDEMGTVSFSEVFEPSSDPTAETVITVEGPTANDVWSQRHTVILDREPSIRHESVNVSPGPSEFLYYRGVRVQRLEKPSMFTYDVQARLTLTEDRTLKYPWEVNPLINRVWLETEQVRSLETALTAPKGSFEHELGFGGCAPSEAFLSTALGLHSRQVQFSSSAWQTVRLWAMERVLEVEAITLSEFDQARLDKAIHFATQIGFPVMDFPIRVVESLGPGVLGQAHEGKILLSRRVMMQGTKMVAGTLIEEYVHLRYQVSDETRAMQNVLIDAICSLGEQLLEEPL